MQRSMRLSLGLTGVLAVALACEGTYMQHQDHACSV
jgi:hypothetical protein